MKKSFITILLITGLYLSGCTSSQNPQKAADTYAVSTYITDEILKNSEHTNMSVLLENEYTPQYMKDIASDVAIITIVDLDHADMHFTYMIASTYGTFVVNNVIYGTLKEGTSMPYIRPGGIISVAEYEKTDFPEAIEKREYLREQQGVKIDKDNTYYDMKMENDISVEAGKTYLAYLHYQEKWDAYEIIGLGNGLREVNVQRQNRTVQPQTYKINDLKIKNNNTGEFESLDSYINQYLKD